MRQTILNNLQLFSPIRAILKHITTLPDLRIDMKFVLSPATILEFPLNDIWFPADSTRCSIQHKSFKALHVKDVFQYEITSQSLIFRPSNDRTRQHPLLQKRFQQAVITYQIYLFPFLAINLGPSSTPRPLGEIVSTAVPTTFRSVYHVHRQNSRTYRLEQLHNSPLPHHSVNRISKHIWKKFWKTKLNFRVKNIWYRLLHNKINTKIVTHRIMPDLVPSPYCPLCPNDSSQYPEHMFVECPIVWPGWTTSFRYLFPRQPNLQTLTPTQVLRSLYIYQFPPFQFHLPAAFLFGALLESIWFHYWKFIFDDVPFVSDHVVCTSITIFQTYVNQHDLKIPQE